MDLLTESQKSLIKYFDDLNHEGNYFKNNGITQVKFSDLFKFRGLLGSGSYGVVMIV